MMRKTVHLNTTLRLSRPFGFTLLLTLAVLVLLIALLEGLARLPWVETHVPTAIGSAHPDINTKFGELDALLKREGRIDCIFVGSSMVRRGIDISVFAQAYREQTGQDIVCYNFGIAASRASSIGPLSEILISRYHPRLLVYGFSLRDLTSVTTNDQQQETFLASSWLQYQFGSVNVMGWLIDHSHAVQHFLAFHDWLLSGEGSLFNRQDDLLRLGFVPLTTRSDEALSKAPDSLKYRFTPTQMNGLEYFLSLRTQTQLLLVEMPVPYRMMTSIKGGRETFRDFIYQARDLVAGYGVPVITTIDLNLIPDTGWGDTFHLNQDGAEIFNRWLGEQIGAAVNAGEMAG
jgi:hypothetical protein